MRTLNEAENGLSLRTFDVLGGTHQRTVIVAGGGGFLGSHLCRRLVEDGHQVICVDNFMTGRAVNVAPLMGNPCFSMIKHDVIDPLVFTENVDEIFNLACAASPPKYQLDPVHTMQTCVNGTLNLLKLAQTKGARFFQASTSEIYGDAEIHPQPECYHGNVNPFGPRACYDEGKRAAETICHDFADRHGLNVKVARIFNTYGPNMLPDDGRVVSNFINQALADEPITIYGSGKQTRSFCYVDDLIEGFVRLMRSPRAVSAPVNLGNPGEFTMLELANLVIEQTGSRSKLIKCALPVDDPKQRRPDISKARKLLDWEPLVPLPEGLERTIAYFSAQCEVARPQVKEHAL